MPDKGSSVEMSIFAIRKYKGAFGKVAGSALSLCGWDMSRQERRRLPS